MEITVLAQILMHLELNQLVVSAAVERLSCKANVVAQGHGKFGPRPYPESLHNKNYIGKLGLFSYVLCKI